MNVIEKLKYEVRRRMRVKRNRDNAKKKVIALDYDDVMVPLNPTIVDMVNEKFSTNYKVEDMSWNFPEMEKEHREYAHSLFTDEDLFANIPLFEGAKEFVDELIKRKYHVIFATATYHEVAAVRFAHIMKHFPHFKKDFIMVGGKKDVLAVNVLIDDRVDNLRTSQAEHVLLFDAPHNQGCDEFLRVKSYQEALDFIDKIDKRR